MNEQLELMGPELTHALKRLEKTIKANPPPRLDPAITHKPVRKLDPQLPMWAEHRRAAPNAIFRSALFPALRFKKGRPFLKNKLLASVSGITVVFTGERFDQSDLDVYLELLNFARRHPLGTECSFSAYRMLKALGHSTGRANHRWLHGVFIRLRSSNVEIIDHAKRYDDGLIGGIIKDEITKHYCIRIDPTFSEIFGYGMWSSIDREQRRAMGRNATAKALHAYYSTHIAPGAHTFETLARIVGLDNPNKRQERATLLKAHELLATVAIGFLKNFTISANGRSIKVRLQSTPRQIRPLANKAEALR